jgi:hypothetical protein
VAFLSREIAAREREMVCPRPRAGRTPRSLYARRRHSSQFHNLLAGPYCLDVLRDRKRERASRQCSIRERWLSIADFSSRNVYQHLILGFGVQEPDFSSIGLLSRYRLGEKLLRRDSNPSYRYAAADFCPAAFAIAPHARSRSKSEALKPQSRSASSVCSPGRAGGR